MAACLERTDHQYRLVLPHLRRAHGQRWMRKEVLVHDGCRCNTIRSSSGDIGGNNLHLGPLLEITLMEGCDTMTENSKLCRMTLASNIQHNLLQYCHGLSRYTSPLPPVGDYKVMTLTRISLKIPDYAGPALRKQPMR